jgi:hypothetical protein
MKREITVNYKKKVLITAITDAVWTTNYNHNFLSQTLDILLAGNSLTPKQINLLLEQFSEQEKREINDKVMSKKEKILRAKARREIIEELANAN